MVKHATKTIAKGRGRRGEGTVRYVFSRRLYEARVSVKVDGVRKQISRYFKTENDAFIGLFDMRAHLVPQRGNSILFDAFATIWLDEKRDTTEVATYRLYESTVRVHIAPWFIAKKLIAIDEIMIDQFMVDLRVHKKATPARRRSILSILTRMLNSAVRKGYIPRNPTLAAEKPRVTKAQQYILGIDEAKRLLAAAKDSPFYALIVLALGTAMREGELFALQWSDVNLDKRRVSVKYSLAEDHDGKLVRKTTKTGRGRVLDISTSAAEVLRSHRAAQISSPYKSEWVFPDSEGGPLRKSNFLRRVFHPMLERAGLPRVRFHSLRHVANSVLASRGTSVKVLQVRGGWSTARMAIDTYGHLLDGEQRVAADQLDDLI